MMKTPYLPAYLFLLAACASGPSEPTSESPEAWKARTDAELSSGIDDGIRALVEVSPQAGIFVIESAMQDHRIAYLAYNPGLDTGQRSYVESWRRWWRADFVCRDRFLAGSKLLNAGLKDLANRYFTDSIVACQDAFDGVYDYEYTKKKEYIRLILSAVQFTGMPANMAEFNAELASYEALAEE